MDSEWKLDDDDLFTLYKMQALIREWVDYGFVIKIAQTFTKMCHRIFLGISNNL